mgnify:CR=1 FL=1
MIDSDLVFKTTSNALSILNNSEDLEQAIADILKEIGEGLKLECTFVIRCIEPSANGGMCYEYEWCNEGVDARLNGIKSKILLSRKTSLIKTVLMDNGSFHSPVDSKVDLFDDFPGIRNMDSYLLIPIYLNRGLWGMIGLEYSFSNPMFLDSSIHHLRNLGISFGFFVLSLENKKRHVDTEQKYLRIIENIRDVVFTLDFSFKFVYLNGGWERLTGFSKEQSLGQTILSFFEPTYIDFFVKELEVLSSGVSLEITLDLPLVTFNKELHWIRIYVKQSLEDEGKLFGTILDIHQNKLNAEKLRYSHSAFKSLFNTVEDVLYIGNPTSRSYYIISKRISDFGVSQEKFINEPSYWLDMVHIEDRLIVDKFIRNSWVEENQKLEYRIINNHGITLWVENRTWLEYDMSGKPYRLHGRLSDITTTKTKELELLESEERFKVISENLPFPLIMCSLVDLEILYFNEFFLNMISQNNSSVRKDFNIDDYVFHPDSSISIREYILDGVEIDNLEVLVHEANGDHWYSLSSQKLPFKGGEVVIIILYNIHKRKLAELERFRLEDVLTALDQTQISFSMEEEFRDTYAKLLSTLIFFTKSEFGFLGEVIYDNDGAPYLRSNAIKNVECSEEIQRFIDSHMEKGFIFKELDNLIGDVLLSGKPLISNDLNGVGRSRANLPKGHPNIKRFLGIPIYKGDQFIGMVGLANKEKIYSQEDIDFLKPFMSSYANLISLVNENKRRVMAESLHKESENLYKILSDNVDDVVSLHDLKMKIRYVSPSIERVTGISPEELIDKDFFEFINYHHEKSIDFESYPKFVIPVLHNKSGKTIKIEMIWKPLYNNQGKLYSFLATSRDVTDRELILSKLKKTLDKEKELNQLKSRFIAMTSHEFRTPLATIFSSNDLLKMILSQLENQEIKSKSMRHIDKINTQLGRLTQMVTDVLLMEQTSDGRLNVNLSLLDINQIIVETLQDKFAYNEAKPCINLKLPNKSVYLKSDRTWLSYIIKNIVENALKYSKSGDRMPDLSIKKRPNAIVLLVQDYGIGVPRKEQKFIFDPFYRSTNASSVKGTGLGLSIVYELVLKLGGKINFKSKENYGTTISIVFPYGTQDTPTSTRKGR